jgi:MCM AAA-lid domain
VCHAVEVAIDIPLACLKLHFSLLLSSPLYPSLILPAPPDPSLLPSTHLYSSARFDLVLVLLDSPQKDWDKRVSTFLLQQAVNAGKQGKSKGKGKGKSVGHDAGSGHGGGDESWSVLKLRDYIAYVKCTFQPVMSAEAKQLLMRYYQIQRQSEDRSQGRTTVRLLESLMRLSEAHAKIMSRYLRYSRLSNHSSLLEHSRNSSVFILYPMYSITFGITPS